jgi:hypothetical protein
MVEPDIGVFVTQHDQLGPDHIRASLRLNCTNRFDFRTSVGFRTHIAGAGNRHVHLVPFLDVAYQRACTKNFNVIGVCSRCQDCEFFRHISQAPSSAQLVLYLQCFEPVCHSKFLIR